MVADNLIFPAAEVGKPVYRTLLVKNTADKYPLAFSINSDNARFVLAP
jgi:hypothetical protein